MPVHSTTPEQAATIPFRGNGKKVEVCLIRRWDSNLWGIPKGTVDPGETHDETALKESWEEAGLRGRLVGDAIGAYRYRKLGATLTVEVYLMEVRTLDDTWQEAHLRERRWFPLHEAVELLAGHPVRPLLEQARSALSAQAGAARRA